MNEEPKQWHERTWDYITNKDNSDKIFGTGSAFLGAIGINAIVQGMFNDNFDWSDLTKPEGLVLAFASGLGVVLVQEDAIAKATDEYYNNDQIYLKYHKENLDLSYAVRDYDFQRYFIKKLNEKEFNELVEQLTTKRINTVKNEIYLLESTQFLLKKKKHISTQEEKLKLLNNELKELEKNGIAKNSINFKPYQVDDIFNFNQEEIQYGRESIEDNSITKHRKKNWLARFYVPIISVFLTGGAAALLTQSIWAVLISSLGFALLLIYNWWNTKRTHLKLKQKSATKREIKLNTHLNDAKKEYTKWKKDKETESIDTHKVDFVETVEELNKIEEEINEEDNCIDNGVDTDIDN